MKQIILITFWLFFVNVKLTKQGPLFESERQNQTLMMPHEQLGLLIGKKDYRFLISDSFNLTSWFIRLWSYRNYWVFFLQKQHKDWSDSHLKCQNWDAFIRHSCRIYHTLFPLETLHRQNGKALIRSNLVVLWQSSTSHLLHQTS